MTDREAHPRFRWAVLAAAVAGCLAVQVTSLAPAPVLPQIAAEFSLDVGTASNYVNTTFLFTGCLVGVLLGGFVCDRFGVVNSIAIGLALATVPAALMPWIGRSLAGLAGARLVEGLAQGFVFPAMGPVMARWFPANQRGVAGGLMSSAVAVGSSAGMFLGPVVFAAAGGWRQMSAWLSLPGWLGLAFAVTLTRLPGARLPAAAGNAGDASAAFSYARVAVSPLTLAGIALTFLATWSMQTLYTLTSTFLAAAPPLGAGYGAARAGELMLGVTLAAGVIGPVVTGMLLDRVFHGDAKPPLLAGFALMSVCVFALRFPAVTGTPVLVETVLVAAGFGVQFALPAIYYFIAHAYPPGMAGKMTGLWTGTGAFGGVLGVYIAGVTVRSRNSYGMTFAIQAAVALTAFLLTYVLMFVRRRHAPHSGAGL